MSDADAPQLKQLMPESCESCGLCCQGIGSPVLLYQSRDVWKNHHPYRPEGIPADLIEEIDNHFCGLFRGQEPQDECLWYNPETQSCQHYEWRPQLCRDYELAGQACLEERRPFVAGLD